MSESQQPMFQLLLKTLEKESPQTKAMFFASPESELIKAYQEGIEARKNRVPITKNPYPKPDDETKITGVYTKHLCWGEGYLSIYVKEL